MSKKNEENKPIRSFDELRAIADPIVETLQKRVGERGSVILMISAPNGGTDSYYVRWMGPLLTAIGLRDHGSKLLENMVDTKPSLPAPTPPPA